MANAFKLKQEQDKKNKQIAELVENASKGGGQGRLRAVLTYAKNAGTTREQAERVLSDHSRMSKLNFRGMFEPSR